MHIKNDDVIAHIITGRGPSAVSVIRISGEGSFLLLKKIFDRGLDCEKIRSHTVRYGKIKRPDGKTADEVLVSFMKAPRTFTGEDTVEINCHGGLKTTGDCFGAVLAAGARPAEPGEFTRRAFLNGRIDLSQAEAVADLIYSKTDRAKEISLGQLSGALKSAIGELREITLTMLAHIEASIDFPEHGLETDNIETIKIKCGAMIKKIDSLLKTANGGKIIREGIFAVIAGKPNVGKSSLLNAILDSDRAIVTDIPGTTRDFISEGADIGGLLLNITDTAGIRELSALDEAEQIGVIKTGEHIKNAELVLFVADGSKPLNGGDAEVIKKISGKKIIAVINKSDLPAAFGEGEIEKLTCAKAVRVSAKYKTGLDELYDEIKKMLLPDADFLNDESANDFNGNLSDGLIIYKERHANCLRLAREAFARAFGAAEKNYPEDLISIDLTEAYGLLGEITGESAGEDIIDKIFSEFCLGK